MDIPTLNPAVIGLAVAVPAIVGAIPIVRRAARERGRHRHLDRAGQTASARVTGTEPLQQSVNGGAGRAVTLEFPDGLGNQRQIRDSSGLGGYLVAAGSTVTVRFSPIDPDAVRVEEIVGPRGPYLVRRPGRGRGWASVLHAGWAVGAAAVLVPWFGFLLSRPDGADRLVQYPVSGLFALVGSGLLMVGLGQAVVLLRRRRRPWPETTGVVTEVWREWHRRRGKKSGSTGYYRYPFAVHFATHDGREVHTRHHVSSSRFQPQPQQRITVCYDPSHPARFEVRELGTVAVLLVWLPLLLGVVFLGIGGALAAANLVSA